VGCFPEWSNSGPTGEKENRNSGRNSRIVLIGVSPPETRNRGRDIAVLRHRNGEPKPFITVQAQSKKGGIGKKKYLMDITSLVYGSDNVTYAGGPLVNSGPAYTCINKTKKVLYPRRLGNIQRYWMGPQVGRRQKD